MRASHPCPLSTSRLFAVYLLSCESAFDLSLSRQVDNSMLRGVTPALLDSHFPNSVQVYLQSNKCYFCSVDILYHSFIQPL
jgi:hypothetical protein